MGVTKRDLEIRFKLSHNTVRDTLRAAGLDTSKREYTDEEVLIFERARALIEEGKSYEEVSAAFRGSREVVDSNLGSEVMGSLLADEVAREVEEGAKEMVRDVVRRMIVRLPQLTLEVCDELASNGDVRAVYRRYREAFAAEVGGQQSAKGILGASNGKPDDLDDEWDVSATPIE